MLNNDLYDQLMSAREFENNERLKPLRRIGFEFAAAVLWFFFNLCVWIGIAAVAMHFIAKFW